MDYNKQIEKEKLKKERKKAGTLLLSKVFGKINEISVTIDHKKTEKRTKWFESNFNSLAIKYIDDFIVKLGVSKEDFSLYIYKRTFDGESNVYSNSIIITDMIDRLSSKYNAYGAINNTEQYLDYLFSYIKAHLERQSQLTVELRKTDKTFITYGKEEEYLEITFKNI